MDGPFFVKGDGFYGNENFIFVKRLYTIKYIEFMYTNLKIRVDTGGCRCYYLTMKFIFVKKYCK